MPSILITAFKPYGRWTSNASWICLQELIRDLPSNSGVKTRLYPVDFDLVSKLLADDLQSNHDFAIHLGQAPDSPHIRFERFALNVAEQPESGGEQFRRLEPDGPDAFATDLPLEAWARDVRAFGAPAAVSNYAGAYLCNAVYYWSRYLAAKSNLRTRACMIHVPLTPEQAAAERDPHPSLSASVTAGALRHVVDQLLLTAASTVA